MDGRRAFELLMIVDDPEIATFVSKNGVDRLFVDLEQMGKNERQGHLSTWISSQTAADVSKIREAAPDTHLLVRVNPLHQGSKSEIDDIVSRGADSIMLPMFETAGDLEQFFGFLNGRCIGVPLVETARALNQVPEIVRLDYVKELFIGLNDLHLDLKLDFMFEPIANGLLDDACRALGEAGVKFGIGGVARADEGFVSPEVLLGEHVRLGSTGSILSRTFHRNANTLQEIHENMDFQFEVSKLRKIFSDFQNASAVEIEANRIEVAERIRQVVEQSRQKQSV